MFCDADFFIGDAVGEILALGLIRIVLFIVGVRWLFFSLIVASLLIADMFTPKDFAEGKGLLSE